MKLARLFAPIMAVLALAAAPASGQNCEYTLNLYDAFGDGWTGNELNLNLDGVDNIYTIGNLPWPTGTFATYQVPVSQGQNLTMSLETGIIPYEISWALLDNNGDTVMAQPIVPFPGPLSGIYYKGVIKCGGCPKPKDLSVNPSAYSAKVRWAGGAGVTYKVVYGPASVDLLAGQGDTATVTQPKYTMTGLFENTNYQVMVWRICPDGSASNIAGPVKFSTYFSDDVGVSAVVSPVSDCDLNSEQIVVRLKNYGANPQSLDRATSTSRTTVSTPAFWGRTARSTSSLTPSATSPAPASTSSRRGPNWRATTSRATTPSPII